MVIKYLNFIHLNLKLNKYIYEMISIKFKVHNVNGLTNIGIGVCFISFLSFSKQHKLTSINQIFLRKQPYERKKIWRTPTLMAK